MAEIEPYCGTCRWWDEDEPERITGRCRINPPQMQGNIAPHGDAMFQTPDAAIWPETRLDDWCGSYTARRLMEGEGEK